MNFITKTTLLVMTFSVFLALFQILLKTENLKQNSFGPKSKPKNEIFQTILREKEESIPNFVSRFKIKSFELWENSDKLKMEIKY
ncbi:hypothetical protein CH354_15620 [Leptospira levettii]|uniref:Uncharacterized protein n=1 Tax=Leptospira levettii TaxID=2023178 RepID=A0A2N0AXM9_9LEPT|nr:hypothetical protein [Leptospira levettii]MCG6149317.1 hypothetical protein [Leptospira levettii]MCW7466129.1 hypothetical protein [Leptospira levettii]MCW7471956.1 hypothetical protein [Leptospira levettii]MCW7496960.1 hypothetical protein [Leptospira levettii]MCW7509357.1 hypothetical protein [Leptospira levettii]